MLFGRRSSLIFSTFSSLLLSSAVLGAQTTTARKPATAVHRAAAPAGPVLPKNIPPVKGPVKVVFALRYQDITVGAGEEAMPGEFYSVNYTGWLASDGTKFDSSYDRGQAFEFLQGRHSVITGWDEGFVGMHVGGKRRLFIPYQLAYGVTGKGTIPPKADLIFDVELMGVRDPNAPPLTVTPPPPSPGSQHQ